MIKDYQKTIVEGSKYSFSASSISKYQSDTNSFFRGIYEPLIDTYTTSTVLGTIVHYLAEQYIKTRQVVSSDITEYLDKKENIDKDLILKSYKDMGNVLFDYIDNLNISNLNCESEKSLVYKLTDNVALTGTCDLILGTTLIDFKTTSQLSHMTTMRESYKTQLYSYLYLLEKNNYKIDSAKLVYITIPQLNRISEKTQKPLKDYPASVYEIGLDFNIEEYQKTVDTINLIAESVEYIETHPDSRRFITQQI